MTPDEQIIALGTLDGYTDIHGGKNGGLYWRGRKDPRGMCEPLPDYDSLDVMHRMEGFVTDDQWPEYRENLRTTILGHIRTVRQFCKADIHSTAAQRREALLRTLNLWKTQ